MKNPAKGAKDISQQKSGARASSRSTKKKVENPPQSAPSSEEKTTKHSTKYSEHLFKHSEMRNYILQVPDIFKYRCKYCFDRYGTDSLAVDGLWVHLFSIEHDIAVPPEKREVHDETKRVYLAIKEEKEKKKNAKPENKDLKAKKKI